jgi:hypothetical protein
VKRIIELLERMKRDVNSGRPMDLVSAREIDEALKELKTPRFYTPERWEAETGEAWDDLNGVYMLEHGTWGSLSWNFYSYENAKGRIAETVDGKEIEKPIICATEAGKPPDDWKPEE